MGNACMSRDKMEDSLPIDNSNGDPALREQARQKYEEARLKYGKYKNENIDDSTPLSMITKFENALPLKKIDIDEFERRLKKLANPDCENMLTEAQIVESFKDSVALKDITVEGSLTRQLILNPLFLEP